MNAALIVAGSLAVLGAAIHGAGGEVLVVRRLSRETLASTRFGGPGTTRAMVHVTWHMTAIAFVTVGVALLLAGAILHRDVARAFGLLGAAATTGFASLAILLGGAGLPSPRSLLRHPGPVVLTTTAVLAWCAAL